MDNQHRLIKGYRELGPEDIELMNEVKSMGIALEALVEKLKALPATGGVSLGTPSDDPRWVAIGATQLQEGLMALTRAIAKPEFF